MTEARFATELEKFFMLSVQMLSVAGTDGYFKRINPSWTRTLGYSADELLSKPFIEFVHPDDREATLEEMKKLSDGQPTTYFENRFRHRNGSYRSLAWTLAPDPDGLLYACALDITGVRADIDLLSKVLEAAPDAMIITRRDGTIHMVNRITEQLFRAQAKELIGTSIETLVPKRLRKVHEAHRSEFTRRPVVRAMGAGRELTAIRTDGTEFPAEISLSPLKTEEGSFTVCAVRDISSRKSARLSLRQTERQLEEQHAEFVAAQKIQTALLPKNAPVLHGIDLVGKTYPAELTGGDLYDFIQGEDGSVDIIVGDVTGHGFSAALLMATTHAYLRAFHVPRSDLCTLVTQVHSALERELDDDRFVSFLIARLDMRDHLITFVNAGHPPGYVIDANGSIVGELGASTWALAMMPHILPHSSVPIPLNEGELVLLMSDGLTEATSPSDEEFGLDRVLETVRRHLRAPAAEIVEALHQSLVDFTGRTEPEDDVTIVVLKRVSEGT